MSKPCHLSFTFPDGSVVVGAVQNVQHVEALRYMHLDQRRAARRLPMLSAFEPAPGFVLVHLNNPVEVAVDEHRSVCVDIREAVIAEVGA